MKINSKEKAIYVSELIYKSIGGLIENIHIVEKTGEIKILIKKEKMDDVLFFLKHHTLLQFKALQDLFAIDLIDFNASPYEINKTNRFQLNYNLLSNIQEIRILLKINVKDNESINSATNNFNSAAWLERETWDLYGIFFKNHPDLRRILTDYGFEGYALRKDFPLSGYTEILYTTELKKIGIKPLELTQEYRVFDFVSPWDIKK